MLHVLKKSCFNRSCVSANVSFLYVFMMQLVLACSKFHKALTVHSVGFLTVVRTLIVNACLLIVKIVSAVFLSKFKSTFKY